MAPSDFLTVLRQAQEGNSCGVWVVLEACLPDLIIQASAITKDAPRGALTVSDLVNDTLLEAFRDFHQFRGETQIAFAAWLRQILLHNHYSRQKRARLLRVVALDDLRSEGGVDSHRGYELPDHHDTPLDESMRREDEEMLEMELLRLPEPQRQLIAWRFQEQLTYREIGARLGCSLVSARELCLKAIGRLQRQLGRFERDPGACPGPD